MNRYEKYEIRPLEDDPVAEFVFAQIEHSILSGLSYRKWWAHVVWSVPLLTGAPAGTVW